MSKHMTQREKKKLQNAATLMKEEHIINKKTPFAVVEAYKAARTNLLFMRKGEGCQKIAVTSTFAGEGKSTTCINLAITIAQAGQRVLILDADLRKSRLHRILGLDNSFGLSETLAGITTSKEEIAGKSIIHHSQINENLYVVTAGSAPPNPAELLSSSGMQKFINALTPNFDYILIDTPPVNIVTDAAVLAKNIDGYIIVVKEGVTPIEPLKGAIASLQQIEAPILGFLLNDVKNEGSSGKYSRYGKYGKYGKYYKDSSYYTNKTLSD